MRLFISDALLMCVVCSIVVIGTDLSLLPSVICPTGWNHRIDDDTCAKLFPTDKWNTTTGVELNYHDATAFCNFFNSSLPVAQNLTDVKYLVSLVGHEGRHVWMAMRADLRYKRIPQHWLTPRGRPRDFIFDWDLRRHMPLDEGCVALHMIGDARHPGGNDKMVTVNCEEKHSIVCVRPRLLTQITLVDGESPRRIEQIWGHQKLYRFFGPYIPHGTLLSFQTTSERTSVLPPKLSPGCNDVQDLTGASAPFALNVSHDDGVSEATVVVPSSWPFVRGAKYSLCFFDPRPFATYRVASEFDLNALGPAAFIDVVQKHSEYLQDVCLRRSADINLFYGSHRLDDNRDKQVPFFFDSPVEGGRAEPI